MPSWKLARRGAVSGFDAKALQSCERGGLFVGFFGPGIEVNLDQDQRVIQV